MTSLTIRNIDDRLKRKLRLRAAQHDRSMEEELREIIRAALATEPPSENLYAAIRRVIEPLGGVELELPPRDPIREPPDFG
ncbi:MAG: FitA-like ribbon-helix-helix domain-containing protein [Stellaceae bacterium]